MIVSADVFADLFAAVFWGAFFAAVFVGAFFIAAFVGALFAAVFLVAFFAGVMASWLSTTQVDRPHGHAVEFQNVNAVATPDRSRRQCR